MTPGMGLFAEQKHLPSAKREVYLDLDVTGGLGKEPCGLEQPQYPPGYGR